MRPAPPVLDTLGSTPLGWPIERIARLSTGPVQMDLCGRQLWKVGPIQDRPDHGSKAE